MISGLMWTSKTSPREPFGCAWPRRLAAWLTLLGGMTLTADVQAAGPAEDEHFGVPQVKFINEQIAAGWVDGGLKPSDHATDGEWCRRVYLDVVGRIPTLAELKAFVTDPSSTKRPDLVDRHQ